MLKRPIFLPEIMKRYGVGERTGRKYMREMGALGLPMMVYEENIIAWEAARIRVIPGTVRVKPKIAKKDMVIPKRK